MLVVIPARNEEASIAGVIRSALESLDCTLVVVDDASTDATRARARAAGALVLPLPVQLGAWGAMQTGMRWGMAHGFSVCVTMDADGQHRASEVDKLLAPLRDGRADVVIGAHPQRGSRARKTAWWLFKRMSGLSMEDLTSGFRAYNRAAMESLSGPRATLFDYQDVAILIHLLRHGLRVAEVPVRMGLRQEGRSRIFRNWFVVAQYMLYSSMICCTKRLSRVQRGNGVLL
jgi:hypothetical protein